MHDDEDARLTRIDRVLDITTVILAVITAACLVIAAATWQWRWAAAAAITAALTLALCTRDNNA